MRHVTLLYLGLAFSHSIAIAGTVEIAVQLHPAGNFTAKSDHVVGEAKRVGTGLVADQVTLEINSLKTGITLRDDHMNNKYFEAKQFPHAVLSSVRGEGGKFTGKLKVHGVEQPIQGTYEDGKTEVTASFLCSIKSFAIKDPKYLGVGADDTVNIKARIPVSQTAQASPSKPATTSKP